MNMSLLQVHAALYALGCFCEVSEHFSSLAVGHIYDLVIAKETTSKTRIQAISVFSRMHSSVLVALKAHETGKAVMLSIPEEEVVIATLEALSKLALKSSIIVPLQANLLLSHICSDRHTVVRAISLKCLTKLATKAIGRTGIEEKAVEVLLSIFESADQPPIMKDLSLQVLRKLFPFCLVAFDATHLVRLLSVVEVSALLPQVQPVLGFLVDLVCCVSNSRHDVLEAADAQMRLKTHVSLLLYGNDEPIYGFDISTRIAVLVCDQLALLGCENSSEALNLAGARDISQGGHTLSGNELKKRYLFLGGLLLQLAQCSSHCSFAVVDRLSGMIEALLTKLQQLEIGQESAVSVMTETEDQDKGSLQAVSAARSYFLRIVCRCIRSCGLIWLSEEGHSSKILLRLTKLVTFITDATFSHHILKDLLLLLLKVRGFISSQQAQAIATKVNNTVVSFVKEEDYWSVYKVVTLAACHGLWNISSEAIEPIVQKAQSGSTYFWLKALAAVCTFEGILQGECENWNHTNTVAFKRNLVDMETNEVTHSSMSVNLGRAIARALSGVYLAESSLAAAVKLERTLEFQRRLLSLRITFVRTSGELLGLLGPICVASDVQAASNLMAPIDDNVRKPSTSSIQAAASKSGMFCTKYKKLAAAFDVLRVSCMGIDEESTNTLSFASLGCSFISFCVLCSLSIPQVLGSGSALSPSMQCLAASVSNDLYQRLDAVGGDEWSDLLNYILQLGGAKESSIIGGGGFCAYNPEKEAWKFISGAVREVLGLQEDMNLRNPELSWLVLARGMHVCKKVVEKWLCLPWALPKRFLSTRLPVSMDVFVELMMDSQMGKEKQIAEGLLAPLSICFQICNLDINGGKKVKRLCGAVMLKSVKPESGELYTGWNLGGCNEMTMCSERELFLLEKLFKEVSLSKEMMWEESNQHGKHGQARRDSPPIVLCSVNEKGQGFASCLLDTSGLKCGVFHVSVLAVCLDKEHRCWIVPPLGDGPTVRIVPSTSG